MFGRRRIKDQMKILTRSLVEGHGKGPFFSNLKASPHLLVPKNLTTSSIDPEIGFLHGQVRALFKGRYKKRTLK